MELNKIYTGKSEEILKTFPDNCFDSVVTDPPYGISFMNKKWDYNIPEVELWKEVLRVLKPGAHALIACGTRTQHRMVVNIEDAGFEIRDVITWHYGNGFPKNMDIGKAIDKEAGAERKVVCKKGSSSAILNHSGQNTRPWHENNRNEEGKIDYYLTEPATDEAKKWNGWGTALKPATEFFTLARKPISEDTIAANVLKHGTGGINIEGSRIDLKGEEPPSGSAKRVFSSNGFNKDNIKYGDNTTTPESGRYPANLIFDADAAKILDDQTGILKSGTVSPDGFQGEFKANVYGKYSNNLIRPETVYGDEGGASRFFYCPKASPSERNKGLPEGMENTHPTVKPVDLIRYLVKLITPPHGLVLDCFAGSGTTGIGCVLEDFNYVLIEQKSDYCTIGQYRIEAWKKEKQINESQLELF